MEIEEILKHRPQAVTETQREFYFENGYLLLEKIVPQEWVTRLCEVTAEMVEKSRKVTVSNEIFDLEPEHTPENPRLRRITSPVEYHPVYWEFASQSTIADIAADLVGPDVKFHHSKLNFKWAKGGEEVKWHQDISFWPHTNYSPLTIGLYLHDVGTDHAPLGVIPGAHKGALFSQYDENGNWTGCLSHEDVQKIDAHRAVYLTGPAGSVTIHNCRMVHGSPVNRAAQNRPLLLNAYSSADAFPYTTNKSICFGHYGEIVRGKAAPWAHHDPRPCEMPPDWSGGYTSIFALQQEEKAG